MIEYHSNNIKGRLDYIDLINYCLTNFKKIHKADDIVSEFRTKVFDVTDTPEQQMMRSMEGTYPGWQGHSFIFQEDNRFSGVFDLDFVGNTLANFRAQLFAKGFFSFSNINKKYASVLGFITNIYDKGIDKIYVYDKIWYDKNEGLVISLSKMKRPRPYLTLTITAEEYAQSVINLLQNHDS